MDAGYSVVALDVAFDHASGAEQVQGDVRDADGLRHAFEGAHAVFHTASYGMSKKAQLQARLVHDINVQGEHGEGWERPATAAEGTELARRLRHVQRNVYPIS